MLKWPGKQLTQRLHIVDTHTNCRSTCYTSTHTDTPTHPCTHWICTTYRKTCGCAQTLWSSILLQNVNSPINMKTYPNAQIIILQHYTYVNPLTIIQWTYVGGTEIYILGLARPPNSTQTLINCILLHKSRQQIRGWIYNTLTLYLRKSTYNPHGHKGAG